MAKGLARQVRRAILETLKDNTGVTNLVAATSIYGQVTPKESQLPFIKLGSVSSVPLKATGIDGSTVRVTVYCYAKSEFNDDGAKTEEAEDLVDQLVEVVESSLDGRKLSLTDGVAKLRRVNLFTRIDGGEVDIFQGVIDFRGDVIAG